MLKYTQSVISLLCLLLHQPSQENYKISLLGAVTEKLATLQTALENYVDISEKLHNILYMLWLTRWKKTTENHIPCLTECLLVLITLYKDGRHQESKNITDYLTKLQYCIHMTCLMEI